MEQAKSLLTINYRLDSAQRFISSVQENQYYFFVGNHVNANTVPQPFDNAQDTLLSAYYGMVFGKKINSNDISLLIRRVDWQSNTVYAMYDHTSDNLYDTDFYVVVLEGSQYDVFKCLENGGGNPSTVAPSRMNVGVDNEDFYYPTDKYRWKYMYSISDADFDRFGTPDFVPVRVDLGVKQAANKGAIDVVSVVSSGSGYSNHFNGSFGIGDVRLNGDPKKYAISNTGVKTSNGFYDACWLYISTGGGAGQYRQIESYVSNSTYNYVVLSEAFDPSDQPQNGSVFEITPAVSVRGDGAETDIAKARAIIDPNGNTVSRVEMLNKGVNYNLAIAQVMYSSTVGVTSQAVVTPIYSPFNGHGYNAPAELGSHSVGVCVKLIGSESNTVIIDNDYSQIGILKNPQFRKVTLDITDNNRDFSRNEIVYSVGLKQLMGTVETTKNLSNVLTATLNVNDADARDIVSIGDTITIWKDNDFQVANVISVTTDSILMDKAALFFTGSGEANVFLTTVKSQGLADGYSLNVVDLTETSGVFAVGDLVVGAETGTYGFVTEVKISDVVKGFGTYRQVYTYIGSMTQGTFSPDEQVYQVANAIGNAKFHSEEPDTNTGTTRFYVTNQVGVFNTSSDGVSLSSEIIGLSSGAIANLTNKYLPDLVFGSGEVCYVENGESITRSVEKTETFKIVLEF